MASLVSYGLCQSACNVACVACYASAGAVFGTVTAGVGTPAALLACNGFQGTCMGICATKFLAEASAETAATGGVMGPVLVVGGLLAGGAAAVVGVVTTGGAAAASGGTAGAVTASSAVAASAAGGAAAGGAAVAVTATSVVEVAAVPSALALGRVALFGFGAIGIGLTIAYGGYMLSKLHGGEDGEGGHTTDSNGSLFATNQLVRIQGVPHSSRLNGKIGRVQGPQPAITFTKSDGRSSGVALRREVMTLEEAKLRSPALPNCDSFCFSGDMQDGQPLEIVFMTASHIRELTITSEAGSWSGKWTTYTMALQTKSLRIPEGAELAASDMPYGCTRAWYGACGNEWKDVKGKMVTEIVALHRGHRMRVNNSVLEGDPAFLRRKVLVVEGVPVECWSIRVADGAQECDLHLPVPNLSPVLPEEIPAFPKGIRVRQTSSDRRGTVQGLSSGLVVVDFDNAYGQHSINVTDLAVEALSNECR